MTMMNEPIFLGGCPVIRPEGIYLDGRRVIRLGLGAVERKNPLPPGKYWVDVFPPHLEEFSAWLAKHRDAIHVDSTESFPSPSADYPPRDWYLFTVSSPVPWEGPGFPTIAAAEIHSSSDTAQRPPPPPDALDWYLPKLPSITPWVWIGATAVLAVVGGALLVYYVPRRSGERPAG